MKDGGKILRKWLSAFAAIILLILFLYWQNNSIVTTEMNISSNEVPAEFDGYKIIQLSDLHSKFFGENQQRIIEKVQHTQPDLIVFTGDLVDGKNYDEESSLTLMEGLVKAAPVLFVTGNHEWWSGNFQELEKKLAGLGVTVLRNDFTVIEKDDTKIIIYGIDDPAAGMSTEESLDYVPLEGSSGFQILLAHRPEHFQLYQEKQFDLIFSGHAHGGQFRLPFFGGMIAPDQGFLPKYDAGRFHSGGSVMIVNRGLGNSIIPQRLFNRPEIIEATLLSK
ncbi:metallophosphoesterase [Bacillus sp. P14.5]|uniref:metallophosphoesterase n=1 Tax=Bacillus sp. P14.5 TaxID=1983400 RepID=UPI000DE95DE4|nr:metallophosphoesterase [Bacillus sp. P14.5]